MTSHARYVWAGFLLALLGCGARAIDADALTQAQESYDQALVAFQAGDHEGALTSLDVALAPGNGLPPDLYTDALVKRALCHARLEQFESALADLEIAEQGSSDLSTVHAARAYVFNKQGDSSAAKIEMAAAKKLNRKIKTVSRLGWICHSRSPRPLHQVARSDGQPRLCAYDLLKPPREEIMHKSLVLNLFFLSAVTSYVCANHAALETQARRSRLPCWKRVGRADAASQLL